MRISVFGCGHVGLVTSACLAHAGHEVTCTDIDVNRIAMLKAGGVPIYEPHLGALLRSARKARRISFTSNPAEAIRAAAAIFICTADTPGENKETDLSPLDRVVRQIAKEARSPRLVIATGAVPARASVNLRKILSAHANGRSNRFRVASNPDFLREGTAVSDFFHPDRIIVGVEEDASESDLRAIYSPIVERSFTCPVHPQGCPPARATEFVVTTIHSAQLIKQASDSFLALKISYANVLADICEKIGADVETVTHAMGLDPRIGTQFLNTGLGFGGVCLPDDLQAFIQWSASVGIDFAILKAAERINEERIDRCLDKVRKALGALQGKHVTIMGLAFKADTDDIRFAPSLRLMQHLLEEGAEVHASDPEAIARTKAQFPQVSYYADSYAALRNADAAIICTDWDIFKTFDWRRAGKVMVRKLVIDGRNLYSHKTMLDLGFEYHSFGRGTSVPAAAMAVPEDSQEIVAPTCPP